MAIVSSPLHTWLQSPPLLLLSCLLVCWGFSLHLCPFSAKPPYQSFSNEKEKEFAWTSGGDGSAAKREDRFWREKKTGCSWELLFPSTARKEEQDDNIKMVPYYRRDTLNQISCGHSLFPISPCALGLLVLPQVCESAVGMRRTNMCHYTSFLDKDNLISTSDALCTTLAMAPSSIHVSAVELSHTYMSR
jgi:hypothetical protein